MTCGSNCEPQNKIQTALSSLVLHSGQADALDPQDILLAPADSLLHPAENLPKPMMPPSLSL